MTDLVRKETLEEICAHRDRALALYQRSLDTLKEGLNEHAAATQIGGRMNGPFLATDRNDHGWYQDTFMERMTKVVDRDIWRGLINGTPIGSLMDRQERKSFEESLEREPPPATIDNVLATFERLFAESDMIFRRGLVNAFKQLDRDYASNDGFKIGDRIVLTYGCSWDKTFSWFRLNRGEYLQDVDRVMHVLDGKPAPEYQQGLQAALDTDMRLWNSQGGRGKGEVTTPYWRAKYFKNGNLHLYPLRKDLHDKCNRIIAEHYGMVVAAGKDVREGDPQYKPRQGETLKADFFPTPGPVIERMLELAEIEPGMKVLEPSAGTGAIATAMRAITHDVWCVEVAPERALVLRQDGFIVQAKDFLEIEPEPRFDRIVMNPPFSRQQDIRHVMHAAKFLKPGGRLVAVMGAGALTGCNRLNDGLYTLRERMSGTTEELPAGSFKESGTGVNTVLLTLDAPAAAEMPIAA